MTICDACDDCNTGDGQGGSDGHNSNVGDAVSVMKGESVVGEVVIGEIVVSHIMEQIVLVVINVVIMEGDDSDSKIMMVKFWSVIMEAMPEGGRDGDADNYGSNEIRRW